MRSMILQIKQSRFVWIIDLIVYGCLLAALLFFVVVGGMLWRGDVWAFIFYAENPYLCLAGGLFFLAVACYLRWSVTSVFGFIPWRGPVPRPRLGFSAESNVKTLP